MTLFALRYDFRCSAGGASSQELLAAALEQCEWADRNGFVSVTLSEHHGSPDGYLPSPMVVAGAIAARTQNIRLMLAALIAPLHDPVRLAEDLAIVDVISNGRLIPVLAAGYVESEFEMFGARLDERARVMDEIVPFLERAWTGEPFEHGGRELCVTPRPVQRPRPPIFMGGSSAAAARRAARLADHFLPSTPELFELFRAVRRALGTPDPGPLTATTGNFLHVAEDPDAAWAEIAPHALHEMNAYGRWSQAAGTSSPFRPVEDADELRATGAYPVLTPDEAIARARALGPSGTVMLHPLMGGMSPDLSWQSLRLIEAKVIPALR